MQADTNNSLGEIRGRYQGKVLPRLLELQEYKTRGEKALEWARNLQCLSLVDTAHKRRRLKDGGFQEERTKVLRRIWISAEKPQADYVAVSYTWHPSDLEVSAFGGYEIETVPGGSRKPSEVRDVVLDRVTTYVKHHKVRGFWIDKECINQSDPEEKQLAMDSMDLVYSRSSYPLALLKRQIQSQNELDLLVSLLQGQFTMRYDGGNPYLERSLSPRTALDVLKLLELVTSEPLWKRAWTFHEEYRSSTNMILLIPHSPALGKTRHARNVIGNLSCELQVSSVNFRRNATLFCLGYRRKCRDGWKVGLPICEKILERAGKYDILHLYARSAGEGRICKSMSPTVFADIGRRDISVPSETLPIAASCCYYSIRRKDTVLREIDCSLSLCLLALYLLNGEILRNDISDKNLLSSNIYKYLEHQSLSSFDPPVGDKELTFLKRCRLHNVRLFPDGIRTTGWLWKLYREIDTSEFISKLPYDRKQSRGTLGRRERARIRQLAYKLRDFGYYDLVTHLFNYLDEDITAGAQEEKPSKHYKNLMTIKLVQAIEDGKAIKLGCLLSQGLDGASAWTPCRGIFVSNIPARKQPNASYAFTVWKPRTRSDDISGVRTVEKFVSLEVDLERGVLQDTPHLRTKGWINGLCFFDGYSARDVIFPRPASLSSQT